MYSCCSVPSTSKTASFSPSLINPATYVWFLPYTRSVKLVFRHGIRFTMYVLSLGPPSHKRSCLIITDYETRRRRCREASVIASCFLFIFMLTCTSPLKPEELQVLRAQYEKEGTYVGVQTKFNYAWVCPMIRTASNKLETFAYLTPRRAS